MKQFVYFVHAAADVSRVMPRRTKSRSSAGTTSTCDFAGAEGTCCSRACLDAYRGIGASEAHDEPAAREIVGRIQR